jgi:Sortase domain
MRSAGVAAAAVTVLVVTVVAALAVGAPQASAVQGKYAGHGQYSGRGRLSDGGHRHVRAHRSGQWTLRIPSIGVYAPVIGLAGSRYGLISVPDSGHVRDAGWYRYGAVPGNRGNALLLGHVDTYAGPAVFYNLYRLVHGDDVWVDLGNHDHQRFVVRSVTEVPKSEFPAVSVFGSTRSRHLWLVTCGGSFNYYTRSYLDNIIVFATAWSRPHPWPRGGRRPADTWSSGNTGRGASAGTITG